MIANAVYHHQTKCSGIKQWKKTEEISHFFPTTLRQRCHLSAQLIDTAA